MPMVADHVVPLDDFGNGTLLLLLERLERSSTFQHYIYREAELDDVWRHVETALNAARKAGQNQESIARLQKLLTAAMEAHDLVAAGSPHEAATRLRSGMQS
jgi:hypothetical protein